MKSGEDEARAALREAIRLKPEDAFSHCNLAYSLRIAGQLDEAIAEYRETNRLEPRLAAAHYGLGAGFSRPRQGRRGDD